MFLFSKSIFTSKVMWGLVIAVTGAALNRYGVHVKPEDAGTLADLTGQIIDVASQAMTVGGSAWAAYGRMKGPQQPLHVITPTVTEIQSAEPGLVPAVPDGTVIKTVTVPSVPGKPWLKQ